MTSEQFLRANPCCIVCGNQAIEPHHLIPKSMRKKGKMPKDWNPDEPGNRVPVCRDCHETYNSSKGPGQMPYMGHDRVKNEALAKRVEWLLAQRPGFRAMLPDYALVVYRMWRENRL